MINLIDIIIIIDCLQSIFRIPWQILTYSLIWL